jgi:zinc transporter ZupT
LLGLLPPLNSPGTVSQGGLKPLVALILNFISGLSVVLGVIIIMSVNVDNRAIGCIIVYGGGVYLQIGLGECMARAYATSTSVPLKLGTIAFFALGAVLIGLVLLDHQHCSAGGGDGHDHGGDGHDHGRRLLGF